jgi:uncharacterized protein with ParB-like and HNH nuclease domain
MAITLFKDTTYSVSLLIESISRGEVALPDIQRPFVWQASKVRDLCSPPLPMTTVRQRP